MLGLVPIVGLAATDPRRYSISGCPESVIDNSPTVFNLPRYDFNPLSTQN